MTTYRLEPSRPLRDEIARVLDEQTRAGVRAIEAGPAGRSGARGAIRRCRSVLRLVRSGVSRPWARGVDRSWAAAARALSASDVGKARAVADRLDLVGLAYVPSPSDALVEPAVALGHLVGASVAPGALEAVGWDDVLDGLHRSWRDARAAMREAVDDPAVDVVRGWRKATRRTLHHVQLCSSAWPELLGVVAGELDAIQRTLGAWDELAVLARRVDRDASDPAALRVLDRVVAERSVALRQEALARGRRALAVGPRTVVAAMERLLPR